MIERPILFKPEMVRATLEGRKTQTRRTARLKEINDDPDNFEWIGRGTQGEFVFGDTHWQNQIEIKSPYGAPGNRLWVRENWRTLVEFNHLKPSLLPETAPIEYLATDKPILSGITRPSIFLPRWASRTILEIIDIRLERIQKISKKDAMAEGVVQIGKSFLMDPEVLKIPVEYSNGTKLNDETYWGNDNAPGAFATYIDKISGPDTWEKNYWVWVIKFKVIETRKPNK